MKVLMFTYVTIISVNCFGQNKTTNPIQNFSSPFRKKPAVAKSVVAPGNNVSRAKTVNGTFYRDCKKENISRQKIEKKLTAFLSLNEKYSFSLVSEKNDDLGFTHLNYQQKFNNIPVDGGVILVHLKNGKVTTMNGRPAEFLELQTQPKITADNSFQLAKDFLKVKGSLLNQYPIELVIAKKPSEKNTEYRLSYKVRIDATNPFVMCYVYVDAIAGEVINKIDLICDADTPGTASTMYSGTQTITNDSYTGGYRLRDGARKIETYDATNATFTTGVGFSGQSDFTNSTTNWTSVPYLSSFTISAIAQSWWYTSFADETPDLYIVVKDGSNQTVFTAINNYVDNTSPPVTFHPNVLLQNPPYTLEIWDYDAANADDFGGSYSITPTAGTQSWSENGNSGTYINSTLNHPALDVHWGMEKTYDFYKNVFNRNSFDGNGGGIKNYLNFPTVQKAKGKDPNGASALPAPYNAMVYGIGDGIEWGPVVGLDVEGHEYSHMVINYSIFEGGNPVGLVYQRESGALNESFADIFGTCVEFYSGVYPDWTIGEGVILQAPHYLRSLSDPNSASDQQPDTYGGTYWENSNCGIPSKEENDYCGVHTNSGVQNFWFYLLCQGGSGTNDIGNVYSVTGIGITQARQIAYRNLTTYLTKNATYYDAFLGSLQSAEDLYGNPSAQYDVVRDAWYAVGIGNSATAYCSGVTNLTDPTGTFTDGSGDANYLINANCKWVIAPAGATQITLNFSNFDTEADYDSICVYDGNDTTGTLLLKWWGSTTPPPVTSSGGALCVQFTSDVSTNAAGWTASYTSTGITPTCGGGMVLATPSGTFNDGSGSGNYGNNQECYWVIAPPCANSVTLSFSAFNTELNYDGIIVYDDLDATHQIALLTGTSIPSPVTSSTGVMIVVFVSDYIVTKQGFTANYTSTGSAYCSATTTLNTSDYGIFSDGSGANNYCNNQDCNWLIQPPQATSITLAFTAFDVETASSDGQSIYDAVEIYDGTNASAPLLGRFTGNALPPSVTSTGGSMYVKFYSDLTDTKTGWTAYYTSTTTPYCTGTTSLTAPSGTFTDGSNTTNYGNNAESSWYIHPPSAASITLTFTAFNTELSHDGVIVYDGSNNSASVLGQFSGTNIPPAVTSTGGNMYIEFLSDQAVRSSGWSASYNSITTGLNEPLTLASFGIYPNPNNGNFILQSFNNIPYSIVIYNLLGENIYEQNNISSSQLDIDLSQHADGVYFIQISSEKESFNKKIIIKK